MRLIAFDRVVRGLGGRNCSDDKCNNRNNRCNTQQKKRHGHYRFFFLLPACCPLPPPPHRLPTFVDAFCLFCCRWGFWLGFFFFVSLVGLRRTRQTGGGNRRVRWMAFHKTRYSVDGSDKSIGARTSAPARAGRRCQNRGPTRKNDFSI